MGQDIFCKARRLAAVSSVVALLVTCLVLPLTAVAQSVKAEDTLSIGLSPVKTGLDLKAGDTITFAAKFSCAGFVPINARITYKDTFVSDQSFAFADPGTEFWSAGTWLKVEPEEFSLSPGQSQNLQVTVTVPPETPDGQYYAAFFVQASPAATSGSSNVGFAGTIASIVCISMGEGAGRSARLVPYGYVPRVDDGSQRWTKLVGSLRHWWRCLVTKARNVAFVTETRPIKIFAPIENVGGAHIQPRVTASLYEGESLRHKTVMTGDIILPGHSKITELAWPDPPLFARVRLELKVEYGGPEPIEVERTFFVLPVKGILGLLAVAFGLGYLGANRGRKRATRPPAASG